jgi:hypothetical protein
MIYGRTTEGRTGPRFGYHKKEIVGTAASTEEGLIDDDVTSFGLYLLVG